MARNKQTPGGVHEYVHIDTEETIGAYVGTELDKVLRDDPDYERVSRRAAGREAAAKAAEASTEEDAPVLVDPNEHSRPELNELASEVGVEYPETLDNKGAVADAINAARAEAAEASTEEE
jgi:hypothetical protein